MNTGLLAGISSQFTIIDWLVVFATLALTTVLGATKAGRQATIRDFFLGGRKLPWWAVSGSIVATELSALTFVSVPWVVFQPGGNLTYLQLGVFGSLLARIVVALWLVPEYFKREIYSPFDYMHDRLGGRVRGMTTVLFVIKAMLAQSSRIYLAAEVLVTVLNDQLVALSLRLGLNELAWAIIIIAVVSITWTLMGGMRTVIWTDVALFACFALGAMVALLTVVRALPGGFTEILRIGWNAKESGLPALGQALKESGPWGKFTFFDWSASPVRTYTIWTAVIANTWGGIGSYGLDQTLAQRIFCCKNARDARWAIISSQISQLVTLTVALVGIGLYAYYSAHPLEGQALEIFKARGDRILPIFVVEVVPRGLKGLIIAAIFAAAISTMMGVLTATSQTSLAAFYFPFRRWQLHRLAARRGLPTATASLPRSVPIEHLHEQAPVSPEARRTVIVSRLLVLFWGVTLATLSYCTLYVARFYPSILDLGLAMAGYILGALLAGFLLSFFPLNVDGRGLMYSAPLSCMCVFALIWHQPWAVGVCWVFAGIMLFVWIVQCILEKRNHHLRAPLVLPLPMQTVVLLLGLVIMLWLAHRGYWREVGSSGRETILTVAWPWEIPIGTTVAFIWGYLLARGRLAASVR